MYEHTWLVTLWTETATEHGGKSRRTRSSVCLVCSFLSNAKCIHTYMYIGSLFLNNMKILNC